MAGSFSSSLHPLTPPLKEEERSSWLRLIRSRKVGVATFFRLIDEHGSACAALDALPAIAKDAGIQNYEVFPESALQAELKEGRLAGARLVAYPDSDYPKSLRDIPDPPPVIWMIGQSNVLDKRMIAIVGARNASSLGMRMARRLAADLADAGFCVVSGLARGIDAAAHQGAMSKGTLAVVAGGVDVFYPAENAEIARQIETNGLRVSEGPIGLQPRARHFPARNRIISGISKGIVVVEAASQSGSLITAKNALDQGREVLAVPGHPFDGRAAGSNSLIRDGATLVRNAEDVVDALASIEPDAVDPPDHRPPSPEFGNVAVLHQQILDRLGPSPIAEDQLIRDLGAPVAQVASELVALEIEGRIQRAPGGLLSLCSHGAD